MTRARTANVLVDRLVDVGGLCPHVADRHPRVGVVHDPADLSRVRERVAGGAQRVGHLLDRRVRRLGVRDVDNRRDVALEPAVSGGRRHADDLHIEPIRADLDFASEGIPIAEESPGEEIADHGHRHPSGPHR